MHTYINRAKFLLRTLYCVHKWHSLFSGSILAHRHLVRSRCRDFTFPKLLRSNELKNCTVSINGIVRSVGVSSYTVILFDLGVAISHFRSFFRTMS